MKIKKGPGATIQAHRTRIRTHRACRVGGVPKSGVLSSIGGDRTTSKIVYAPLRVLSNGQKKKVPGALWHPGPGQLRLRLSLTTIPKRTYIIRFCSNVVKCTRRKREAVHWYKK